MNLLTRLRIISAIVGAMVFSASALAGSVQLSNTPLSSIEVHNDTLFPEGIDYNPKNDKFVVGSFRQGAVFEIDAQGNSHQLIQDDRLHSVLAVRVDSKNNKLYAANSDIGASLRTHSEGPGKLAGLGVYELSTGKLVHYVDLGKLVPENKHLANDIALDNDGNAYITDSFSPVIYKVDSTGIPSILLKNDTFIGDGINLNGIVYHPDGYLIVVKKSDGTLYKIPVNDPESFQAIKTDRPFIGGDGLILSDKNELVIIANRASGKTTDTAFSVRSDDQWATAKVTDSYYFGDVYPTTGVIKNKDIFVVFSSINRLLAAPAGKKPDLKLNPVIQKIGSLTQTPKAFVYIEVQNSIAFNNVPWQIRNQAIASQPGFINKTWLSGAGNNSVGGFYGFDSIENAQRYVSEFFPNAMKTQGIAHTSRIFDARVTAKASQDMNSRYFSGTTINKKPKAFVYTELQNSVPFDEVNWKNVNTSLKNVPGLLSKTWLSGFGNQSVGGIYAFDSMDNAKHYAVNQFPEIAQQMNAAFYTRVFDATVVEKASKAMNSPYYP